MNKISQYDDSYIYKGFVLVNELYEDDERFFKNWYQWGIINGENITNIQTLEGLSSNIYAPFKEAITVFKELVDNL